MIISIGLIITGKKVDLILPGRRRESMKKI
jgi:hypothetical protein